MPRFYCDYCDAYLTHDSMSGRQQHMRGWKHRENVKIYYQAHFPQWAMEQQMLQMQDPQYAAMMAAGFMPPPFGMVAPDGSNNDLLMQQQQAQMQMQMQLQMQMQQQAGLQPQQQQPQPGFAPSVPPPIFRPPPSMAPPPSA